MDSTHDSDAATPGQGHHETGRFLVTFADEAPDAQRALSDVGLESASARELGAAAFDPAEAAGERVVVLDNLRVAVLPAGTGEEAARLARRPAVTVEPERIVYAQAADLTGGGPDVGAGTVAAPPDEAEATWGLQAIGALVSRHTGRDVAVAVLDTGFDLEHPDFEGRTVVHASFIPGESVQDGNGHGTHCIGTACGPRKPEQLPAYGVAYGARIFAGKVLSNEGRGADGSVLAGINWAIEQGCRVISMSLGSPTRPGDPHSPTFERVAQRALAQGTIIVAAAGNDSRRHMNFVSPVSHPANCPSILAVAAIDSSMAVARFSNQGSAGGGGEIDLAAPGVAVYSSYPMPTRYRVLNGTSMATPHVAGVAAMLAEMKPDASAEDLKAMLLKTARKIAGTPPADVGAGLVQAP